MVYQEVVKDGRYGLVYLVYKNAGSPKGKA